MQATGKPFGRKLVETLPNVEMKAKEQQETLDNLIRQTIVSDSFLSFTKTGESPVQWIHWLDTIDQQNTNKVSKGLKVEVGLDVKDNRQEEILGSDGMPGEVHGVKDSLHSSMKGSSVFGRGLQASGERIHPLKFPEAMVAFAQAAAKANDLPGWPLMSPSKVQMQKCDKCSQEFCSPLNFRRHMRTTHRRSLNVDKEDLKKKKVQVAAYWDKLTLEEARNIVSFKNISIADLSAASVVRALSTHLQQPGLLSLPPSYVKVATALLDIVQNKALRFPLHSEELLSILEDASEKNLLCGVTSASMQRCIFDSEPGKVGLETKNLVASLGFLVELRLVKAWMDDKDVEALRCQKELVEEEEAAQKKREKLQERKRLKKIRQKESKDKERKGSEPSSGLQILNIDQLHGGNRTGHAEGDDSPTATQSSPSSSAYSGQDPNHPDSSHMDLNEFEAYANGKVDNIFSRLADEESLHGDDNQLDVSWSGSSNFFRRKVDVEEAADSASFKGKDACYTGLLAIDGEARLQNSSHGDFQGAKLQNSFSDQKVENGKPFMEFRTRNGKFIPDRKTVRGWRERKQIDSNDFSSYQKQPYGFDRRYYDYSHSNQKGIRKPYNMAGNSIQEFSGVSTVSKLTATPRYGQYREKSLGLRRPLPNSGNGHAVWTRKVQQSSVTESERPDEKSKGVEVENRSNSLEVSVGRQLDGLLPEDACPDGANVGILATSADDTVPSIWPASPEKSEGTLSRDSSVSFGSGISQSSTSVSATIGAEEQVIKEYSSASTNFSAEVLSDPILSGVAVEGTCGWAREDGESDCQSELNMTSGALVIGSLRVPLGDAWANVFQPKAGSNFQEKLKRLSVAVEHVPGKKQKGDFQEINESLAAVGKVSPNEASSICPEVVSKESAGTEEEAGASLLGISRESYGNDRDTMIHQVVAGEESPRQTNLQTEKLVKQGLWPNGANKLVIAKVWRPVVAGERNETLNNGSLSGAENCVGEEHESDVTSSVVVPHRETGGSVCSNLDRGCVEQSCHCAGNSDGEADAVCHVGNVRVGNDEESTDSSGVVNLEGLSNSSLEVDVFETGASAEDLTSHQCRVEDGGVSLCELESRSWSLHPDDIANFLSQRWEDAVASSDEARASSGTSVPCSLSSPSSDDGMPSDPLQDEGSSLYRTSHSESDIENARYNSAELSCEDASTFPGTGSGSPRCNGKDVGSFASCGMLDASDSSTSETAMAVERVQGSDIMQGESAGFVAGASGRTGVKSDRWPRNQRVRTTEPRYMPRRRELEEKN